MELQSDPRVKAVFAAYPAKARKRMHALRSLVLQTARETEGVDMLEETLKWGEPSYLAKKGSTLRMDWKAKKPDQFALYFKCTSSLVESFKAVYGNAFQYEGNRALIFGIDAPLPEAALKPCIRAALTYHKVKQLPHLGLGNTAVSV